MVVVVVWCMLGRAPSPKCGDGDDGGGSDVEYVGNGTRQNVEVVVVMISVYVM